jgi:hypothetical protein
MNKNSRSSLEFYLIVFLMPWFISAFIHKTNFFFQIASLMGISISLFVCYLVPLYLWSEQVKVANEIQTNFRDSVRQIYEGDKLSVKESFEIPNHIEYVYCADVSTDRLGYKNIAPLM